MLKVAFWTLGCKVNQAETEEIKNILLNRNFEIVDFENTADIYIINTCTVTQIADKKSRQMIRRTTKNKNAKIIVCGCYVNNNFSSLPEIDFIVRQEDKYKIPDIISNIQIQNSDKKELQKYIPSRTRIFLKIQDGCNQFCSYCIVPYVRSNIYSVTPGEILSKIRIIKSDYPFEVVLCGIRLGKYESYSNGKKINLIELISLLEKEENVARIRLSSIEPQDINQELISCISLSSKVCPHLHIPLQSGDDEILQNMKRNYTKEDYFNLVKTLQNKVCSFTLTSDVIVGFPGESEKHFLNTYNFIKNLDFLKLHVFKYSRRKQTSSYNLKNNVPEKEKTIRSKILLELSEQKNFECRSKYINKTLSVLVEKHNKENNLYSGLSENYIRVFFSTKDFAIGNTAKVKIIEVKKDITYGIIDIK